MTRWSQTRAGVSENGQRRQRGFLGAAGEPRRGGTSIGSARGGTLLALAVVLAGCAASDPPADPAPTGEDAWAWAARALPSGAEHDHFVLAHHRGLSTPNFRVLGHDPLVTSHYGAPAGGYFCGEAATTSDGRRLMVANSYTSDMVAFVLVDVTDAAAPHVVSEFVVENARTNDVAITPDGRFVVLLSDPYRRAPAAPVALALGASAPGCPERVVPTPRPILGPSVVLVDVQDPARPRVVDVEAGPGLGHSISTAEADGVTYVVASHTNVVHAASLYEFYTLDEGAAGPDLVLQSVYQLPPGAGAKERPLVNGHMDATVQKHPVTGRVLAWLSDWDAGLVVLDITEPAAPRFVSRFNDWSGEGHFVTGDESGNLHNALPVDALWDGRHYTILGQEIVARPPDRPSGWIYVLDTTDPARPVEAGRWTLPVEVEWDEPLLWSTHYVDVVGRTLFVSHYHAGVWAVDVSTPERIADPPSVGVFVPDRDPPAEPATTARDGIFPGEGATPAVLEVQALPDGTLVVLDAQGGLYAVSFDAGAPIAPPPTWRAQQSG